MAPDHTAPTGYAMGANELRQKRQMMAATRISSAQKGQIFIGSSAGASRLLVTRANTSDTRAANRLKPQNQFTGATPWPANDRNPPLATQGAERT